MDTCHQLSDMNGRKHPSIIGNSSDKTCSPLPSSIRVVAVVHITCLVLCSLAMRCQAATTTGVCLNLPNALAKACVCTEDAYSAYSLNCKGLDTTVVFRLDDDESRDGDASANAISGGSGYPSRYRRLLEDGLSSVDIKDCPRLAMVDLADFASFSNLKRLRVTNSSVQNLQATEFDTILPLEVLDLSSNAIESLSGVVLQDGMPHLKHLNMSRNRLRDLGPSVFGGLRGLDVLDLSGNLLDEDINPDVLKSLPESITYLDLSGERRVDTCNFCEAIELQFT